MATRALPALVVIALLSLAAKPGSGKPPAVSAYIPPSPCDAYSILTGGATTYGFGVQGGVTQPLPEGVVVSSCSPHVQAAGWSAMLMQLREWDPTTLAPDPNAIALRSTYLDPSALFYYTQNQMQRVDVAPTLITRSVAGVADPPRTTVALEVSGSSTLGPGFTGYYEPSGDPNLRAACSLLPDGSHAALPGPHPVIAQGLCFAGADVQALRIGQAVSRADGPLPHMTLQIVQRFRVPELLWLRWVELAGQPNGQSYGGTAAKVSVLDLAGSGAPPVTLPAGVAECFFPRGGGLTRAGWAPGYDLNAGLVLVPGHDYALLVDRSYSTMPLADTIYMQLDFHARTLDGNEPTEFTSNIGTLWSRESVGAAWGQVQGRALSFKLVGTPIVPLEGPPVERQGFLLSVAPNPSRGDAAFAWSGAVGAVRGEVLDARGRRVASFEGGAAGRWSWRSVGRDGRPLAAGAYFVRLRDSQGGRAMNRITLTR